MSAPWPWFWLIIAALGDEVRDWHVELGVVVVGGGVAPSTGAAEERSREGEQGDRR